MVRCCTYVLITMTHVRINEKGETSFFVCLFSFANLEFGAVVPCRPENLLGLTPSLLIQVVCVNGEWEGVLQCGNLVLRLAPGSSPGCPFWGHGKQKSWCCLGMGPAKSY